MLQGLVNPWKTKHPVVGRTADANERGYLRTAQTLSNLLVGFFLFLPVTLQKDAKMSDVLTVPLNMQLAEGLGRLGVVKRSSRFPQ